MDQNWHALGPLSEAIELEVHPRIVRCATHPWVGASEGAADHANGEIMSLLCQSMQAHRMRAGRRGRALWGVGLVAVAPLTTLAAVALASAVGCSPAPTGGSVVAASPAPTALAEGPAPPQTGLSMPTLDLDWRPPSAVAGDVAALAAALAAHPRVALLVDDSVTREVDDLDAMRLAALVTRLAPQTAVRSVPGPDEGGPHLADVLREDPPLAPEVDPSGRTRWALPDALALDQARLRSWAEGGDPAVLMFGAVGVEAPVWRELATGSVGTCAPLFDALMTGQRDSLAELEPFLDHADALLGQVYLDQLTAVVPVVDEALAEFEVERERRDFDGPGWARYECGRAYREYLRPFAACVDASEVAACSSAPRLFLQSSVRVGSVEPSVYISSDCPRRLERDVVEELRAPARAAAELVAESLDVRWLDLVERLATLSDVYGALDQLCRPARRRFAAADLAALREQVAGLGPLFTRVEEPAHDARFLANDGSFHVPRLGRVRQLARYDAGTGSAARALRAAAAELAEFERAHGRCIARPSEPPLMAMLIGTGDGRAEFLGYYYGEELWCDELGPVSSP